MSSGGQLLGQHDRLVEVDVEDAAADAEVGRRRRGGGHRGDRGHVDRPVARRLGDRAGAEVVVGREQRAVAEVLGAPGDRPIHSLPDLASKAWTAKRNGRGAAAAMGPPESAGVGFGGCTLLNYDSSYERR